MDISKHFIQVLNTAQTAQVNFDPEWRVVVTTTSPFDTVQEVISKVHSYDLPMIIYDLAELPEGTLDRNRRSEFFGFFCVPSGHVFNRSWFSPCKPCQRISESANRRDVFLMLQFFVTAQPHGYLEQNPSIS